MDAMRFNDSVKLEVKRFIEDGLKVEGTVVIELRDARTKEVLHREVTRNLVVAQGRGYIRRNIIKAATTYNGGYLAVSTSTTAVSDDETSMPATILGVKAATKAVVTVEGVEVCEWSTTFGTNEANGTIGSVGICENNDGSGLWARVVLSNPITKDDTMELTVRHRIQVSSV